jgi:hypothetical protein
MTRSPSLEVSFTFAPRAPAMGAESEAVWAQQRGELVATQQIDPSSFQQ